MDAHSLGLYLRETRESKELTLDDAIAALKIRSHILESFEKGNFVIGDASPVQIRGFIRNYARFLGLDGDLVIQYYESTLHNQRRKKRRKKRQRVGEDNVIPIAPRSLTDTQPTLPRVTMGEQREASERRMMGLLNAFVVVLVGVAALAVIVFVIVQLLDQPESTDESDRRAILGELPPTVAYTSAPTFTPRPVATDLPQIAHNYTGQGVLVTIETQQRTWMRILTDNNLQTERLFLPGELHEYQGLNEVFVSAGNAKALNIIYNGQQQGSFGGRGQAVEITFTVEHVSIITGPGYDPTPVFSLTPRPTSENLAATLIVARTPSNTPGPSPTSTNTPTITNTPSATSTLTDTPTASDTPTITPTPSDTPTVTPTPTITPTPSITPTPTETAILPPRTTQPNPTPTKDGA